MSKRNRIGSIVWEHFDVNSSEHEIAICNLCDAKIRRGAAGAKSKSFSTKSLVAHKDLVLMLIVEQEIYPNILFSFIYNLLTN